MRCVVFELAGGGGHICAPPAVRRWLRPPAVRGLIIYTSQLFLQFVAFLVILRAAPVKVTPMLPYNFGLPPA